MLTAGKVLSWTFEVPGQIGRQTSEVLRRVSPGRRRRRFWTTAGRAHIEVRGVHDPGREQLVKEVQVGLRAIEGVHSARLIPALGRVVVTFDPDGPSVDDILGEIGSIEDDFGVRDEPFPHDRPEHPADYEPIRRETLALAGDMAGLVASAFGQMLRLTPFPVEWVSVVSLVDNEPRLRAYLEEQLGAPLTDLGLGLTNALGQALSQGPLGLLVDAVNRGTQIRESRSRLDSWERREAELSAADPEGALPGPESDERPVPLPGGPVERYADASTIASLAAACAAFPITGSARRSASLIIAGLPKAGRLGREAFAASLGRQLAGRDFVVLDRAAMRRLDRVDLVLIDDTVTVRHVSLGEVESLGFPLDRLRRRAQELFDESGPNRLYRRGRWALGPLDALLDTGARATAPGTRRTAELRRAGTDVLAIAHDGMVVGIATLEIEFDPYAEALVEEARRGGLHVALAGSRPEASNPVLRELRRVPGGPDLAASVRQLQRDGHVVLLVSGSDKGLRAADCGVGVPRVTVPWESDVLVNDGLSDAAFLVRSAVAARAVSGRSIMLAAAGSGIGGVWSLMGPANGAARRAALPVNAAALAAQVHGLLYAEIVAHHQIPRPQQRTMWHAMDASAVMQALGSGYDGLSEDEAKRRRRDDDRADAPPALRLPGAIAAELANPLTPLLGIGAGLAAAVGSFADAGLVAAVTGVNAVVGGVERMRSEVSIERLRRLSDDPVKVRRAGVASLLEGDELVPGDLIEVGPGDLVPADCRILDAVGCEVDESALTGESLPVPKQSLATPGAVVADRRCMLYEGTTLSAGSALAVVVDIGSDTEVGRSLADAPAPPPSGVETRINALTRVTVPATIASGAAVGALSIARGRGARRSITSGVSLMVAAVPEGLPLLSSVAQLASARRLSRRGALVRNPRTIEALGRVDTLCFDKTGTLTSGEITLHRVSDGMTEEDVGSLGLRSRAVLAAALRATPTEANGPHATDRAIVEGAQSAGVTATAGVAGWQPLSELAFDPVRGYHAVVGDAPGGARISVKGAPEVITGRCTTWLGPDGPVAMTPAVRQRLQSAADLLAEEGLRVLAVAEGMASNGSKVADEEVNNIELVGFVALADSVRPTAAAAVAGLRAAGTDVVMITGDHPSTARAIGEELGIVNGHRVVTGSELEDMSDEELDVRLEAVSVFARITPKDKVRIVRSYQRIGRVVAMTGDGANDAPAIRLANAGIALGERSSPAAREAADLLVVDDRIETIIEAIVEGRALWASVRDALAILVGGNMGEVGFTVAATALAGSSPLNARQLLLVNLLTDMLPATAIATRPPAQYSPEMLLREGPDASLGPALAQQIALRATTTAGGAFAAWLLGRSTGTRRRAGTVALVALVGTQLGQTAAVGGTSPIVIGCSALSAVALAGIVQTPGVSHFFGCTPLGPVGWSIGIGSAAGATGLSVVAPWIIGGPMAGTIRRLGFDRGPGVPVMSAPSGKV